MALPGIKTVLLDVDGTLLDSNDQQSQAWLAALGENGFHPEYAAVRSRKLLASRTSEIFKARFLQTVQPTPGARALLERLKANGHGLVVATSAGGDTLESLLDRAGVSDLIDSSATSSDVANSKPDADLIQAALAKSGSTAVQAVMLGDTPYDIEAARKAGVKAIAFRCGGWWDDAALSGAVAIHDHPAALLASLVHMLSRASSKP